MVFLPPYKSPSFPFHRRLHSEPVCGLGSTVQTRRIPNANHECRTGTKPERLAAQKHMRAFMENACTLPLPLPRLPPQRGGLWCGSKNANLMTSDRALNRTEKGCTLPVTAFIHSHPWGTSLSRSRFLTPAVRRSYILTLSATVCLAGWRGSAGFIRTKNRKVLVLMPLSPARQFPLPCVRQT